MEDTVLGAGNSVAKTKFLPLGSLYFNGRRHITNNKCINVLSK